MSLKMNVMKLMTTLMVMITKVLTQDMLSDVTLQTHIFDNCFDKLPLVSYGDAHCHNGEYVTLYNISLISSQLISRFQSRDVD